MPKGWNGQHDHIRNLAGLRCQWRNRQTRGSVSRAGRFGSYCGRGARLKCQQATNVCRATNPLSDPTGPFVKRVVLFDDEDEYAHKTIRPRVDSRRRPHSSTSIDPRLRDPWWRRSCRATTPARRRVCSLLPARRRPLASLAPRPHPRRQIPALNTTAAASYGLA